MSVERRDGTHITATPSGATTVPLPRLRLTDRDGETLSVAAYPDGEVFITSTASVLVTPEDGLALLSFLADALGVERFVPPAADAPGGAA